ncbi:hypothetical protein MBRA1_000079 [Malassezia brasiliensis]|uniref:Uncharacterized protein n=1 Tax=Malassezia brasiliensis TaxID=1821822 RepID=A0AAF0DT15_9BASI|nr:hypothetical protein MBRA1_000079 [Malassezia brasiliensis]
MASTDLAARDAAAERVQQRYEAREAASYTIWPPSPERSFTDTEEEARRKAPADDSDNAHRHHRHHRERHRAHDENAPPTSPAEPSDDEEVGPQPYTEMQSLDDASAPGDASGTQRRLRRNYATDERRAYLKQQAEERARKEAEIIAQFRDMVDTLQNTGSQHR